jgi:hypothetical protein
MENGCNRENLGFPSGFYPGALLGTPFLQNRCADENKNQRLKAPELSSADFLLRSAAE